MVFIETSVFTKQVAELLSDEEYVSLQTYLAENPTAGDVIQGTGGLRKLRWAAMGKGKRGGVRVIYFHVVTATQMRLLLM
jgi:mRNA-degrading endonuclease RelE of RelBE toxin-antitoxin system